MSQDGRLLRSAILSLLRSCLGPQTANWAILAGVFDITITFHHLLSPLRFLLKVHIASILFSYKPLKTSSIRIRALPS